MASQTIQEYGAAVQQRQVQLEQNRQQLEQAQQSTLGQQLTFSQQQLRNVGSAPLQARYQRTQAIGQFEQQKANVLGQIGQQLEKQERFETEFGGIKSEYETQLGAYNKALKEAQEAQQAQRMVEGGGMQYGVTSPGTAKSLASIYRAQELAKTALDESIKQLTDLGAKVDLNKLGTDIKNITYYGKDYTVKQWNDMVAQSKTPVYVSPGALGTIQSRATIEPEMASLFATHTFKTPTIETPYSTSISVTPSPKVEPFQFQMLPLFEPKPSPVVLDLAPAISYTGRKVVDVGNVFANLPAINLIGPMSPLSPWSPTSPLNIALTKGIIKTGGEIVEHILPYVDVFGIGVSAETGGGGGVSRGGGAVTGGKIEYPVNQFDLFNIGPVINVPGGINVGSLLKPISETVQIKSPEDMLPMFAVTSAKQNALYRPDVGEIKIPIAPVIEGIKGGTKLAVHYISAPVGGLVTAAETGLREGLSRGVGWFVTTDIFQGKPDYYITPEGKFIWSASLQGQAPPAGSIAYRTGEGGSLPGTQLKTQAEETKRISEEFSAMESNLAWGSTFFTGGYPVVPSIIYGPKIIKSAEEKGILKAYEEYKPEIWGIGGGTVGKYFGVAGPKTLTWIYGSRTSFYDYLTDKIKKSGINTTKEEIEKQMLTPEYQNAWEIYNLDFRAKYQNQINQDTVGMTDAEIEKYQVGNKYKSYVEEFIKTDKGKKDVQNMERAAPGSLKGAILTEIGNLDTEAAVQYTEAWPLAFKIVGALATVPYVGKVAKVAKGVLTVAPSYFTGEGLYNIFTGTTRQAQVGGVVETAFGLMGLKEQIGGILKGQFAKYFGEEVRTVEKIGVLPAPEIKSSLDIFNIDSYKFEKSPFFMSAGKEIKATLKTREEAGIKTVEVPATKYVELPTLEGGTQPFIFVPSRGATSEWFKAGGEKGRAELTPEAKSILTQAGYPEFELKLQALTRFNYPRKNLVEPIRSPTETFRKEKYGDVIIDILKDNPNLVLFGKRAENLYTKVEAPTKDWDTMTKSSDAGADAMRALEKYKARGIKATARPLMYTDKATGEKKQAHGTWQIIVNGKVVQEITPTKYNIPLNTVQIEGMNIIPVDEMVKAKAFVLVNEDLGFKKRWEKDALSLQRLNDGVIKAKDLIFIEKLEKPLGTYGATTEEQASMLGKPATLTSSSIRFFNVLGSAEKTIESRGKKGVESSFFWNPPYPREPYEGAPMIRESRLFLKEGPRGQPVTITEKPTLLIEYNKMIENIPIEIKPKYDAWVKAGMKRSGPEFVEFNKAYIEYAETKPGKAFIQFHSGEWEATSTSQGTIIRRTPLTKFGEMMSKVGWQKPDTRFALTPEGKTLPRNVDVYMVESSAPKTASEKADVEKLDVVRDLVAKGKIGAKEGTPEEIKSKEALTQIDIQNVVTKLNPNKKVTPDKLNTDTAISEVKTFLKEMSKKYGVNYFTALQLSEVTKGLGRGEVVRVIPKVMPYVTSVFTPSEAVRETRIPATKISVMREVIIAGPREIRITEPRTTREFRIPDLRENRFVEIREPRVPRIEIPREPRAPRTPRVLRVEVPREPRTPRIPRVEIPRIPRRGVGEEIKAGRGKRKERKTTTPVIPYGRRYGKFKALGMPTSLEQARAKGFQFLRTTLGATFEVRTPKGERVAIPIAAREFRAGKKGKDIFQIVQRAPFRLGTRTERAEIISARKAGRIKFI